MVTRDRLPWLLFACVLVAWIAVEGFRKPDSGDLDRARTFEAELPALRAQLDTATALADSLTAHAARLDTVVAGVRDSADVAVRRARGRLVVQRDTIRVLVTDTVALRIIDERDAMFEGIIVAKDSVITAVTLWGEGWRASSFAKDTVISVQAAQIVALEGANEALHSAIRSQGRQNRIIKAVLVLGAGLAAYDRFTGG